MGFLKSLIDTGGTSSSSRAVLLLVVFIIVALHIAYNVQALILKHPPIDFTTQDMVMLGIVFSGKLVNTVMEVKGA